MKHINDGGPAFPRSVSIDPHGNTVWDQDGMSLRDWFAGEAMRRCPVYEHDEAAAWCYERADAMLKAREVNP